MCISQGKGRQFYYHGRLYYSKFCFISKAAVPSNSHITGFLPKIIGTFSGFRGCY